MTCCVLVLLFEYLYKTLGYQALDYPHLPTNKQYADPDTLSTPN